MIFIVESSDESSVDFYTLKKALCFSPNHSVCLCVCVSVCLCVCHQDCDEEGEGRCLTFFKGIINSLSALVSDEFSGNSIVDF